MKPMIRKANYKDRPAICVETGKLRALFLPEDGGKLASLQAKSDNWEFLTQTDNEAYRVLTYDGSYVDAECSACDEMFPTIDPCTPSPNFGMYPDHGEVCRMQHDVFTEDDSVRFFVTSRNLDYTYQKKVTCDDEGNLVLAYTIENPTSYPFPNLWAMHCMLRGDPSAQLVLPYKPDAPAEIMFGPDNAAELPRDRLLPYQSGGATYKFYYLESMQQGICGCVYRCNGHKFLLEFDKEKLPYLGIWLNSGGFKDMYNLALEPCTAPFDTPDRAEARGYGNWIGPCGKLQFSVRIIVE